MITHKSVAVPIIASLFLLGAREANAQADLSTKIPNPPVPSSFTRQKIDLTTTENPPKIDGDLSDACWKNATKGYGFFRFPTKDEVTEQTEVWMCASKKSLYIAFHCLESHPESIKASETQRNGNIEQDDRVLVLIDSQSGKRDASEFWVTARGTQVQNIEGGSADNQAWQGDWTAATKRTNDGWIVEIEIPFTLLKYPKNAHSFGMLFGRQRASESSFMLWPFVPPEGNGGSIVPYLSDFGGLNPPAFAPKPTISPYILSTAGQGTSSQLGLDIKYPLTTTLTSLATIKPDFATVEGAVQDLSFSYTERSLPDRRPFFAEGGRFLDDDFLFYSPRIRDVDYGLKITGKQGTTNLGFLSTGSYTGSKQYANLASFDNELGTYSSYGGTFLNSHQTGGLGGEVIQLRGQYGWANGANKVRFFGNVTESNLDNGKKGQSVFAMLRSNGGQGRLQGGIFYGSTTKDFDNPLGLVNNPDAKGIGFNAHRFDIQTKGKIENKSYYFGGNTYNHIDGTFFSDNYYGGMENSLRNGFGYGISASIGKREAFHDQVLSPFLSWNQKSLLSGGKFSVDFGHQQNKPYQFTSVSQGFPVGKAFSLNLNFGQARIGTETNWQGILSGTYRIDPLQSFGGRLVTQNGTTNLYLSYGKRTRKGNDLFILFGDPNSETTKRAITIKLVRSF